MLPQFQGYNGTFAYKTDSKNRVNVVPSWRPPQGMGLSMMASYYCGHPIIKVLTDEAVTYRLGVLDAEITDIKVRGQKKTLLKRLLREVSINEQGKMLIPRDLAHHAGIAAETEVMLSAADSHFEIWNQQKFESHFGLLAVPEDEDLYGTF